MEAITKLTKMWGKQTNKGRSMSATPRFPLRPVFDARCSMIQDLADGTVKYQHRPKVRGGNVRILGISHVIGVLISRIGTLPYLYHLHNCQDLVTRRNRYRHCMFASSPEVSPSDGLHPKHTATAHDRLPPESAVITAPGKPEEQMRAQNTARKAASDRTRQRDEDGKFRN